MPQFYAASRCVTPRLTLSIADVIFCSRTVFMLNLVCFGEELKEWWWWKWGGGRGGMVEIVIGNQVDRLWGRDF